MKTPRRILFAIKEPESRSHAMVDKVIRIARSLGARLDLFNAISSPVFLDLEIMTGRTLDQLKTETIALQTARLEKLAGRSRKLGVPTSVAVQWDFPPDQAIVRRAKAIKADLIVVECHRGRRHLPWLLHLTDWETLRESPVPVLLLKNTRVWRNPSLLAAVDPAHVRARSAGLDEIITRTTAALARKLRGSFDVAHVNSPSLLAFSSGDPAMDAAAMQIGYDEQKQVDRAEFRRFADLLRIPADRRLLVEGQPSVAIPDLARSRGSDVVVMGAVSRSGLQRVFIGNTAERSLDSLSCDVLVVKAPHTEAKVRGKVRGMRIVAQPPLTALTA